MYTSGKDMHIADTLSHAVADDYRNGTEEDLFDERVVHAMKTTAAMDTDTQDTDRFHSCW